VYSKRCEGRETARKISGRERKSAGKQSTKENIWSPKVELSEGWRKLHNEELRNLYCSPNFKVSKSEVVTPCHEDLLGSEGIAPRIL
jgi:hypothetical protein